MIAIIGIRYRTYVPYKLYELSAHLWDPIVRPLSFLFLDDFEGNANISAAIKSGSTVYLDDVVNIRVS